MCRQQAEKERDSAEERVKRAASYDATLEVQTRDLTAQLAESRDRESQHRTTAAQMRYCLSLFISQ